MIFVWKQNFAYVLLTLSDSVDLSSDKKAKKGQGGVFLFTFNPTSGIICIISGTLPVAWTQALTRESLAVCCSSGFDASFSSSLC